jgi:DNA invertase Pin-like site-specific DNA recombinase
MHLPEKGCPGMRTAIYGRVSTFDKGQDPELQLGPLRDYCKARGMTDVQEFVDICTGSKDRRPELDKLMELARKRLIDNIVVWKMDRFGRSLKHLVLAIDELNSLGVSFISYMEQIDFSTPVGKLMFHIIAAMAEFERELIRERVKAGLENAKKKGKLLGRKPVAPIDVEKIVEFHKKNPKLSIRDIARKTKLSKSFVGKILKHHKQ